MLPGASETAWLTSSEPHGLAPFIISSDKSIFSSGNYPYSLRLHHGTALPVGEHATRWRTHLEGIRPFIFPISPPYLLLSPSHYLVGEHILKGYVPLSPPISLRYLLLSPLFYRIFFVHLTSPSATSNVLRLGKKQMNLLFCSQLIRTFAIMKYILMILFAVVVVIKTDAQELQARVTINHNQIQGTDASVFDNLQQTLEQFINDMQWTSLQFQKNERIVCNFNITVTKYDQSSNIFTCNALIQANRPVYNSSYTTTLYNNKDDEFNFEFAQFDQLNYNEEQIDNQLTALIAYYAYLIIGLDLDSFSPMGGEDLLQRCLNLTNNAQNLSYPGWKAFENDRNRFAIINDYMEGAMRPFRQLQYDYYRTGLDEMANNVERGRTNITTTIETNLKKVHEDKPLSLLPQIWTDYKKDELAGIYKGKGTPKEKESVYDILFSINASQNNYWEKIKE